MMFSTGLPILYPFAAVFYFGFYWAYKFLLLKYYMKTSKFTSELPIRSTSYIPAAVLMHIFIGGLMVTNSNLLPSTSAEGVDERVSAVTSLADLEDDEQNLLKSFLQKLFTTEKGIYYVVLAIGYVAALMFKKLLIGCAWKLAKACCGCAEAEEGAELDEDEIFSTNIYKDLSPDFL